ncbi:hypothetical protein B484DRAFT_460374 [Ochromonadaceae sp. CCMP2298]|nr:hypothetical protein B484DRAFT_460374 [Ochromonadaceae sp. CCMP2298]
MLVTLLYVLMLRWPYWRALCKITTLLCGSLTTLLLLRMHLRILKNLPCLVLMVYLILSSTPVPLGTSFLLRRLCLITR